MKVLNASLVILFLSSVTAFADDNYVSWTFDDFDKNCELVEAEQSHLTLPIEIEPGELGW